MTVTEIRKTSQGRFLIYIDDSLFCPLYGGELSSYHIEAGSEISQETCDRIKAEVLVKRARLRAMNLLMKHSFTESGLRSKLSDGSYPGDILDDAIEYVKSFGYVDDRAFARDYINSHSSDKSIRRIVSDLSAKGIRRELIDEVIRETADSPDAVDEVSQIRQLLRKRHFDPETADLKELHKTYSYLFGRGYGMDVIRKSMSGAGYIEFSDD